MDLGCRAERVKFLIRDRADQFTDSFELVLAEIEVAPDCWRTAGLGRISTETSGQIAHDSQRMLFGEQCVQWPPYGSYLPVGSPDLAPDAAAKMHRRDGHTLVMPRW
jgi:hypothetical protein